MANEFIIKINKDSKGDEVSLSNMSIESADALKIFIESLSEFAKLHPNSADLRLSLKDGCIESALTYPETSTEIGREIGGVLDGTSDNNDYIRFLKNIQNKIKLNGLDYSVLHKVNNQTIDLTARFKAKNFAWKRGPRIEWKEKIVFIEGELFESGGKVTTNVHIDSPIQEYIVECTQEEAKKLNDRLFDKVYLCVLKKWAHGQKDVFYFVDSYLKKEKYTEYRAFFESIQENKGLERFDIVHNKIVEIVESEVVDNGELLKIMRLYNHKHSDRGVIRTILMTLKPIKNQQDKISEMYNELANTLRMGSSNQII